MYSLNFVRLLKKEQKGKMKKFYKWFGSISSWLVPAAYYALYISYFVTSASYDANVGNEAQHQIRNRQSNILQKTLGYFSSVTNIISCVIMVLVVKSAIKLIESFKAFEQHQSEFQKKIKLNVLVTVIHISLIFLYTILRLLVNNFF